MRRAWWLTAAVCAVGWSCSSDDASNHASGAGGAQTSGASTGSSSTTSTTGTSSSTGSAGATGSTSSAGGAGSGNGGSGNGGSSTGHGGGGTTIDGGKGGAPADASADGPRSEGGGLSCAGTVFCDDFEKQTAGMRPTGMFKLDVSAGATMTVDTTKAFSGKQSVAIKIPNPGGDSSARMLFNTGLLPLASNDLHGRAMVWVTKLPFTGQDQNVHWDLTTASGAGGIQYTLGSMFGNFMAVYQPGDCSVDTKTKWPEGQWACVQWEFKGAADGSHLLRMMLNGQLTDPGEVTTMGPPNCVQGANREWKAATWTQLTFGWINFQAAHIPIEMWIDDVAFGENPIDCPAMP